MEKKGIAVIGAGMIGAAHASGYRAQLPRFLKREPGLHLSTVCDANQKAAQALAAGYGFPRVSLRWQEVVAEDSIRILSVALPNFLHEEVTYAALSAGKHVICEKPLALTAAGARILCAKAAEAGLTAATVFNYRRFPAVAAIKKLVEQGRIGDPVQIVVQAQSEYAADPQRPFSWRYSRQLAGGGALYDVGTHAIDAAMFLCGELEEILGAVETTVIRKQVPPRGGDHGARARGTGRGAALRGHRRSELRRDEVQERLPGPFFRQPGRGGHGQHALFLPRRDPRLGKVQHRAAGRVSAGPTGRPGSCFLFDPAQQRLLPVRLRVPAGSP